MSALEVVSVISCIWSQYRGNWDENSMEDVVRLLLSAVWPVMWRDGHVLAVYLQFDVGVEVRGREDVGALRGRDANETSNAPEVPATKNAVRVETKTTEGVTIRTKSRQNSMADKIRLSSLKTTLHSINWFLCQLITFLSFHSYFD